ncbi:MAG: PAS domain S-box protein [Desulfocapsaceae bacterium]|nr:PAS domain S-box protein [Desulfocapsaceae bacterium]
MTSEITYLADLLLKVLHNRKAPESLPAEFSDQKEVASLFNELLQIRSFVKAVATGDLSGQLSSKGYTAGVLKGLQASLKHLTWQTQMIASGDFSHRLDFMGDFSKAFNSMTTQLKDSYRIIKEKETQLKAINSTLTQDIAERNRAVHALRQSEERYRALVENAPIGIFKRCLDGDFLYSNPSLVKTFRCHDTDEFFARYGTVQHRWRFPEEHEKLMELLLRQKRVNNYEMESRLVDGTSIWVALFCTFDSESAIIDGWAIDITDRKQAENDLRNSEEIFRGMVESAPFGIILSVGEKIHNEYVNPKFTELFGYTIKDIPSDREWWPLAYPETEYRRRTKAGWNRLIENAIRTQSAVAPTETVVTCKDGSTKVVEFTLIPLGEKNIIFVTNLSERKLAEEAQAKLQAQLTHAQKMESVGRLAGGVAHDFNNMLGVIIGNTEMALDKVDPQQNIYRDLQEVLKAARRSADLTRQLLTFARKQAITPRILDLNETVQGMLTMLQRLIGEDITLAWQPEADLWPVEIDPSQVDQILANLCVNSRDAITGIGRVIIETGITSIDEKYSAVDPDCIPGDYTLLAVSDNGCGMNKEVMKNLFEPFFTTKEVGKGTGLGLATIYGIVKQNNGFINVFSEPGRGSVFKIYLPRYTGCSSQAEDEELAKIAPRGSQTILVVEDEAAILRMTTSQLRLLGYTVLSASTPGQAIRLATKTPGAIDLLLTDVVMPEMNGRVLAEKLFSIYPNLIFLFMSGYSPDTVAHYGVLEKGANFLQKPFSRKDLEIKVRLALEKGKTSPDKAPFEISH